MAIDGSNTGSSVNIKGTSSGTAQICVTKYQSGNAPCCECKEVTVVQPIECLSEPSIYMGTCGGYPSVHPHWRFGLIEDSPGSGTYSWSATNFTFDTSTTLEYVVGRPSSAGFFTIYCTVTYNCTPSGTVTYNLSLTMHTDDCSSIESTTTSVSPNPVISSAEVSYELPEDGTVTAILKSQDGQSARLIIDEQKQLMGNNSFSISQEYFSMKGIYILDIYFNGRLLSQGKIMKN
ncbi:MAG: hypothetical protein ACNS60_00415 [Candidatus Cyclobacteriaceae bacterium M2_1C_046]